MLRGKDQVERENQHQAARDVVYTDRIPCCRGKQGCWTPGFGCARNYRCDCHQEVSER